MTARDSGKCGICRRLAADCTDGRLTFWARIRIWICADCIEGVASGAEQQKLRELHCCPVDTDEIVCAAARVVRAYYVDSGRSNVASIGGALLAEEMNELKIVLESSGNLIGGE